MRIGKLTTVIVAVMLGDSSDRDIEHAGWMGTPEKILVGLLRVETSSYLRMFDFEMIG